jgi:DNA-binding transcriptional regulator YiaG
VPLCAGLIPIATSTPLPTAGAAAMSMPNASLPSISHLNHEARLRLRQLRKAMGLSRPKFANLLSIPPTTLKNYELGYREIGGSFFLLIANHNELNEYVIWLMNGTHIPQLILTADTVSKLNP